MYVLLHYNHLLDLHIERTALLDQKKDSFAAMPCIEKFLTMVPSYN